MTFLLRLQPARIVYAFALFQGLAYYALIYLVQPLSPWKGHLKLLASLLFLGLALCAFLKKATKGTLVLKPLPLAVKLIGFYLLWSGISFWWGNSLGFTFGSVDLKLFIFLLWLNLLCEYLTIVLLSYCDAIDTIALSFFKGFRDGSVLLALVLFVFFALEGFSGRLSTKGDILQPIIAAMLFALGGFASIALFVQKRQYTRLSLGKTALWLFPLLVSMVLTVGKTALLSFPLSFLAYIILIPLNRQLKTTIIGFFIVTLGLAIPVIIPTLSNMSYDTLTTLTGRLEVWDMTWALIQEAPWFGHGMGSVVPELNWNRETAGYTGQAHNLFLNIWFQLGAVGLTLVASFFITFAGTAVKAYQKIFMRSQAALGMSVWLLMVFLTATMSGLVGFYLPVQYLVMVLLWMSPRWHQHQVSSS